MSTRGTIIVTLMGQQESRHDRCIKGIQPVEHILNDGRGYIAMICYGYDKRTPGETFHSPLVA